jgi:hypothetical protein
MSLPGVSATIAFQARSVASSGSPTTVVVTGRELIDARGASS